MKKYYICSIWNLFKIMTSWFWVWIRGLDWCNTYVLPEGSKLIGIDSSEKVIKEAKNSYPFTDFRHEKFIDDLNFPDTSFDVVITVDTIECIPNKPVLLSEINRVLKRDVEF